MAEHDEHQLDFARRQRTGLNEAVLCEGKTVKQIQAILDTCGDSNQSMLLTRMSENQWHELGEWQPRLNYDLISRTAIFGEVSAPDTRKQVAIVTGGSADQRVAKEALRTLAFHGIGAAEFTDIGVAGLWRLQEKLPELETFPVIICAAGMDAALPTVLAGLVPALIIAVPTSTGYGRAKDGETALNALLCSCAQGLAVVNIDNGFGAACAAIRALGRE